MGTGRKWKVGEAVPEAVQPALDREAARRADLAGVGWALSVERLVLRARARGVELAPAEAKRLLDEMACDRLAVLESAGDVLRFRRCACGAGPQRGSQCSACLVREVVAKLRRVSVVVGVPGDFVVEAFTEEGVR